MTTGNQRVAVPAAGHQAVLKTGGGPKFLDQEQAADQNQQDNRQPSQGGRAPVFAFLFRPVVRPVVTSVQRPLLLDRPLVAYPGPAGKNDTDGRFWGLV